MKVQMNGRAGVVAQPLYAQVRERLMERIINKEWRQGQSLPNEFDLARQFDVSIGTIRKAVEGLEAAKIVIRKQGRGTFVSRDGSVPQTEPVSWFADAGTDVASAAATTLSIIQREATAQEAAALALTADRAVIVIRRRRSFLGGALVLDRIALPRRLFFDLEPQEPLPDNLYEFYGDYFGVRAVRCRERVTVVGVADEVPTVLGLAAGAPALKIDRTSFSASGEPMEWRESFCVLPKGLNFSGAY